MKRKKLVTRSVVMASIDYLAVNIEAQTTFTATQEVIGPIKSIKEAEKVLDPYVNIPGSTKLVAVNSIQHTQKIYGMSEAEFVKNAHVMTNRTSFEPVTDEN